MLVSNEIDGKPFKLEHFPEETLRAQFDGSNGFDADELRRPDVGLFIGDAMTMTIDPAGVWDQIPSRALRPIRPHSFSGRLLTH